MKKEELRIGNLVETIRVTMQEIEPSVIYDKVYTRVEGINDTGINPYLFNGYSVQEIRCDNTFERINPIILNHKLLSKLGFENYQEYPSNNYFRIKDFVLYEYYNEFYRTEYIYNTGMGQNEYEMFGLPITSVNQLQNVYFYLTGEELIIDSINLI